MDGEVWNEVFDAIFAPVLVVATVALYERLVDAPHTRWSRWILVAALAVAANGIGVHSVANRLHWLVNPGQVSPLTMIAHNCNSLHFSIDAIA